MTNEPPESRLAPPETEREDLEITDLRGARPPRSHGLLPTRTPARDASRRANRWRLARLGGALVALALTVVLLLYGIHSGALVGASSAQRQPSAPPLPTPVLRYPNIHDLQCLQDDAWSPDSRFFAYAGSTSQGCGYGQYFQNVVNIYRARDGAFVRQLTPDPEIIAALGQPVPPSVPPGAAPGAGATFLMYNALLWSRDGSRFAIVFSLNTPRTQYTGVAVVTTEGRVERVVATQIIGAGYLVFDLAAGSARAAGAALDTAGHTLNFTAPPALAYVWSSGGQLVPVSALTPANANAAPPPGPIGPIGNPNGDPSFTIWQPGQIQCDVVNVPGRSSAVAVYFYDTFLAAWSPDGRYVAAFFATGGRLQPAYAPVPDHAALAQLQATAVPLLPLRDRALSAALRDVGTPQVICNSFNLAASAQVAYRPDGQALALLDEQGNFAVYAAGSGAALYPYQALDLLSNTHNGDAPAMRWSPDGTMLLLPDGSLLHVGRLSG